MQNIKNFRLTSPTESQLLKYKSETGEIPQFLTSEDGQDWYECQKLFADDTIKILYDENNVIRSVIDTPIPQRGNTYAVSMFFPLNMSVSEIDIFDYTAKIALDGTWVFDAGRIYQDVSIVKKQRMKQFTSTRDDLIYKAVISIVKLQSSVAIGNSRNKDAETLIELQRYIDSLRSIKITDIEPEWPIAPLISM